MDLLQQPFLNNRLEEWIFAASAGIAAYLGLLLIVRQLSRRPWEKLGGPAARVAWVLKPLFQKIVQPFLILVAFLVAIQFVAVPVVIADFLSKAAIIAAFIQALVWTSLVIGLYTERYVASKAATDPTIGTAIHILSIIARFVAFSLLTLVALDQVGVNVTALVAGLGVGGIAIALAVQNVLGDLLASLTIILDKPFVVGDFLVVGEMRGTVENVGLKTTRLRSLDGEQLVVPNSDLLGSRIRNFKRMQERRVNFKFGVLYETPLEKLKRIPEMVRTIVEALPKTRFDRAHFTSFGDSSLDFEVVYYVGEPDYLFYADSQQAVNLALFEKFGAEGIGFAYPTRTLYVNQLKG